MKKLSLRLSNFEMSRNGQVFFVNNRIQNLVELEAMIKRNIPDCRVCIGQWTDGAGKT